MGMTGVTPGCAGVALEAGFGVGSVGVGTAGSGVFSVLSGVPNVPPVVGVSTVPPLVRPDSSVVGVATENPESVGTGVAIGVPSLTCAQETAASPSISARPTAVVRTLSNGSGNKVSAS